MVSDAIICDVYFQFYHKHRLLPILFLSNRKVFEVAIHCSPEKYLFQGAKCPFFHFCGTCWVR